MLEAKPTLKYRADIDGLRAIAVLDVIFFHLKVLKIWGGFIGVDVFFVISGFLISSVILKEMAESRFSLSSFYQRRIRRILPVLFIMMLATSVAAYYFLLPSEFVSFGKSLLAATFSVSNGFFWLHSGYFDASAVDQPLLHTWSLAVEEQFYIAFPLFLLFVRRFFPQRLRVAIVLVACGSFAVSAVGAYRFPTAAFYLPFTRAWELLLGTMLSLSLFPSIRSKLWRNAASANGLLLIVFASFKFDVSTPFPGIAALAPCVGAALIIAAGEYGDSAVGSLLSTRPFVFIGLISYSLYIWHWPIVVFQRTGMIQSPGASGRNVKAVIFIACFAVAVASWKYIETPFRKGRLYLTGASTFRFAAASSLGLIAVAAGILRFHGFPARYSQEEIRIASYTKDPPTYRMGTCFIASGNDPSDYDANDCMRQDKNRQNDLLFGDSHAAQLWYGLAKAYPTINFLEATSSGCEPTLEHRVFDTRRCNAIMDYVFNDYVQKHTLDQLILAARWEPGDMDALGKTIEYLKLRGVSVVLIGPIVQYDLPLPRLLAVSLKSGDASMPSRHELIKYRQLDESMARLASERWNVPYISYFKLLCPSGACLQYAEKDVPIQFDYGHLTTEGSWLVGQRLKESGKLEVMQTSMRKDPVGQ
jgi:peptidoglycan/LPS O-acetylase OafA/YrhL